MTVKEGYFDLDTIDIRSKEFIAYIESYVKIKKGELNIQKATLLVLDMQKFFVDPISHAFIPSVTAIIPKINRLIEFFESNKRPVVFTRHINTEDNGMMMKKWWKDLITPNSSMSQLIGELKNPTLTAIVDKSQYDAFYETDLDKLLKKYNTKQLVITGVMTHLCCDTTVRSGFVRGYEIFFPVDSTATYNSTLHLSSLLTLSHGFAYIVTVDELLGLSCK